MNTPVPPSAGVPSALDAFLRGVERRAALLAQLQGADPDQADAAVGATMRAFAPRAATLPMAGWPVDFWGLLLAAPGLRDPAGPRPAPFQRLARLGPGVRAAWLLQAVASLAPDAVARVLGVSAPDARAAMERARATVGAGGAGLAAALQQALEQLPLDRLARLAALRQRALQRPAAPSSREQVPGRRPGRASAAVALGCALALLATWMRPAWFGPPLPRGDGVRTVVLPPADPPAAGFDADLAAWSHPDFDLLADPAGLSRAQALPFLAWVAGQGEASGLADIASAPPPDPDAAAPGPLLPALPVEPAAAPASAAQVQAPVPAAAAAVIARLPAPLQPALRVQAARWASWDGVARAAFLQRQSQWDALPVAQQGARRERYLAWRTLDPAARAAVLAAATDVAALDPDTRQALHRQFAEQDGSVQRGWLLGPALGAAYPRLQPLLAQRPAAERDALLRVLRELPDVQREALAVLAQRVPPQDRDALLQGLVSTAADQRGPWLRAQLAR